MFVDIAIIGQIHKKKLTVTIAYFRIKFMQLNKHYLRTVELS
jgi:hypothetical protein